MQPQLECLATADTKHAVEIANRVWWVGHLLEDEVFQCHTYLLEQGNESVLFDPGSPLTFPATLRKIREVVPFTAIKYFVCHHQDPDITAALPIIDSLVERSDAAVVTHMRTQELLKHYGISLPFWRIDAHDWRLPLKDRELQFIFTPYAHFPAAFCSFDRHTRILFSSDLFGGFSATPSLLARDRSHFEAIRPFHEHYIPGREILDNALAQIGRYPVAMIAPQHGAIIPPDLVEPMMEELRGLDCGIYLYARYDTNIERLSQLNAGLRAVTRAMLQNRDFGDIAQRLFEIVGEFLPVERIDYYANLDAETPQTLAFSVESQFRGAAEALPPEAGAVLGKTRAEWETAHHEHSGLLCHQLDVAGRSLLAVPLFSPRTNRASALAVIRLNRVYQVTGATEQLIQQIALPLEVALERAVLYWSVEEERQKAYNRSIRDPLTGLFTRFYMQDVMHRYCAMHDRDANSPVGAILLDVDHFKQINDTLGHGAGDAVLQQIGRLLLANSRAADVPIRLGGEEFIVFLIGPSALRATEVAERLRRLIAVQRFATSEEQRIHTTVSLGAGLRAQGEPLESLIKRVDEALYAAKRAGRNRVVLAAPFDAGRYS